VTVKYAEVCAFHKKSHCAGRVCMLWKSKRIHSDSALCGKWRNRVSVSLLGV